MENMHNNQPETEPVHEGMKFLQKLDRGYLADEVIQTQNGPILVKNFLDICGDHVRPLMVGFETLATDDPRYEPSKRALQNFIGRYVNREM